MSQNVIEKCVSVLLLLGLICCDTHLLPCKQTDGQGLRSCYSLVPCALVTEHNRLARVLKRHCQLGGLPVRKHYNSMQRKCCSKFDEIRWGFPSVVVTKLLDKLIIY